MKNFILVFTVHIAPKKVRGVLGPRQPSLMELSCENSEQFLIANYFLKQTPS